MPRGVGKCKFCDKVNFARDMCRNHYNRWSLHGDPHYKPRKKASKSEIDAFLRAIPRVGEGCIIWPFCRSVGGYAMRRNQETSHTVSKHLCIERYGEPPHPDMVAAHSCGKGHEGCVAPWHLSWKTHTENCADALAHGTRARGEKIHGAKLTYEKVSEIKILATKEPASKIAKKFGISTRHVYTLLTGKYWRLS